MPTSHASHNDYNRKPPPAPDGSLPTNAVATDSEWDTHLKDTRYGPWLSTTFVASGGAVEVYVRDDLPLPRIGGQGEGLDYERRIARNKHRVCAWR
jgi:hypothetical protein